VTVTTGAAPTGREQGPAADAEPDAVESPAAPCTEDSGAGEEGCAGVPAGPAFVHPASNTVQTPKTAASFLMADTFGPENLFGNPCDGALPSLHRHQRLS
jgi:hypothetical protein